MALFDAKAPKVVRDLMRDFSLTEIQAAGVVGNLGHESGGFAALQEVRPTVAGSRGGYGWCQWTGPRRVSFEKWCRAKGLRVTSDEANYGYLCVELRGDYAKAVVQVRKTTTLKAAVETFEAFFEKAGVKAIPSRVKWAERALAAYRAGSAIAPIPAGPIPGPKPPVPPVVPAPAPAARLGFWATVARGLAVLLRRNHR